MPVPVCPDLAPISFEIFGSSCLTVFGQAVAAGKSPTVLGLTILTEGQQNLSRDAASNAEAMLSGFPSSEDESSIERVVRESSIEDESSIN